MPNAFYNPTGNPSAAASGLSATMRAEFTAIAAGFALLPVLSGNANKAVVVNSGGSGMTVTTGTLALAGNFATTGAFNTTLIQGASVSLTLPVVSGTLATLAGAEILTNKDIHGATFDDTSLFGGPIVTADDVTVGGALIAPALTVGADQVVGARDTGWVDMTGVADKSTAFATSTVSLPHLAGRVMAIQTALELHGLLGA